MNLIDRIIYELIGLTFIENILIINKKIIICISINQFDILFFCW
jgi:hypothetical protein